MVSSPGVREGGLCTKIARKLCTRLSFFVFCLVLRSFVHLFVRVRWCHVIMSVGTAWLVRRLSGSVSLRTAQRTLKGAPREDKSFETCSQQFPSPPRTYAMLPLLSVRNTRRGYRRMYAVSPLCVRATPRGSKLLLPVTASLVRLKVGNRLESINRTWQLGT